MRPYNAYRNPELSQPVSSVENTLASPETSSAYASFDILRSLSEPITIDCRVEIPGLTETPKRTPAPVVHVEKAPAAPVHSEKRNPVSTSSHVLADKDDDDYDCMNDDEYKSQCAKMSKALKPESDSPTFEELMARTAEEIARMRAQSSMPQPAHENTPDRQDAPKSETKRESNANSQVISSAEPSDQSPEKKRFFHWDKARKLLFSRESIKLTILTLAVCAVLVSAVIYKQNIANQKGGLSESDVAIEQESQPAGDIEPSTTAVAEERMFIPTPPVINAPEFDQYSANDQSANRQSLTDQMRDDAYTSPIFDSVDQYSQQFDSGRALPSPHNANAYANNAPQTVNPMPTYDVGPQYAEVAPAIGIQYNSNDYESPLLEDDSVQYSETGYNDNDIR